MNNDWLDASEVIPGMNGEDYNGEPATVLMIKKIKDFTKAQYSRLIGWDDAGWLPSDYDSLINDKSHLEVLPEHLDSYLVAVEDDNGSSAVFVYDESGFMVPATERWKLSKRLSKTNKSVGVFEHLKSFNEFANWRDSEILRDTNDMIGVFDTDDYKSIAREIAREVRNTDIPNKLKRVTQLCKDNGYEDVLDYREKTIADTEAIKKQIPAIEKLDKEIYDDFDVFLSKYTKDQEKINIIAGTLYDGGPYGEILSTIENTLRK